MSESFPVMIDGVVKGNLTVAREGLNTVFSARCEDPGRIVRLSVYGGGREGYLGVMTPVKGALQLMRRVSRAGLSGFPLTIEYAGEAGQSAPPRLQPPERRPGCATIPHVNARRAPRPKPPEKQEEGGLLWYPTGDGSLYTQWENRRFHAIPLAPYGLSRSQMVEKRTIEGVDYAVYELPE